MIYYSIELDEIFQSGFIDANFFGLIPGINWSKVEILGIL